MRVYIVAGGDGRPGVWVRVGGGSCGHLGDGCPGIITPHHRFFRPLAEAGGQVYLAATVFNSHPPTHPPVPQLDNRWPLVFTIAAAADVVGNVWAPAAPQSAPPPLPPPR